MNRIVFGDYKIKALIVETRIKQLENVEVDFKQARIEYQIPGLLVIEKQIDGHIRELKKLKELYQLNQ